MSAATPRGVLSGWRLPAAIAVWCVLVASCVAVWAVSYVVFLDEPLRPAAEVADPTVFTQEDIATLRSMGLPGWIANKPAAVAFLILNVVYFGVAALIVHRRWRDPMGLVLSFVLVFLGSLIFSYAFEALGQDRVWAMLMSALMFFGFIALALTLYLFPDGRFVPSWTRVMPLLGAPLVLVALLPLTGGAGSGLGAVVMLGLAVTGAYAQIMRYRRVSSSVQRLQTKWVALGLAWVMGGIVVWFLTPVLAPPTRPGPGRIYFLLAGLPFGALVGLLLPTFLGVAMLRHRLWDVEVAIRRTAVYAPLSGILMGLYVGSIRLFQTAFLRFTGQESDLSILLSGLVLAGVFWPLRLRLQSAVDRYLKEAPDPTNGLRNFQEQVGSAARLADLAYVSRRLLDESVAAFQAQSGAVYVAKGDDLTLTQTAGAWDGTAVLRVPLQQAGQTVGELRLGLRHKGREYSAEDRRALERLAGSVAPVFARASSAV